jgi:hypothetical protein
LAAWLAACVATGAGAGAGSARADVRDCVCTLESPDVGQTRGCSLCVEAAKHSASERVILVRDNDPTKPNRWLALPRAAYDGANPLAKMSAAERLELWDAAIAKGRELWGDSWAVAFNGDMARRQCHAHIHVGKLLEGKEDDNGYYVDDARQLPAIADGTGLWFHPAGKRLHVHAGEQINETVLMR